MQKLADLLPRKYVEAESLYMRALSIYEHQLGVEHPDTQMVRENYTALLQAMEYDVETKTSMDGLP